MLPTGANEKFSARVLSVNYAKALPVQEYCR